jgi:uncharacterized protein YndB with AHSA1/START domain
MLTGIKALVRSRAKLFTWLAIVALLLIVGVSTVWASPPKTVNVQYSVVINRPVSEVWAFTSNPENASLWIEGLRENRLTSAGPLQVGSVGRQVTEMAFGIQNAATYRITEYVANQRLSYTVTSGVLEGFVVVEAAEPEPSMSGGTATRITWSLQGTLDGASKLAAPVYTRMFEKQLARDFATLKSLLESSN